MSKIFLSIKYLLAIMNSKLTIYFSIDINSFSESFYSQKNPQDYLKQSPERAIASTQGNALCKPTRVLT